MCTNKEEKISSFLTHTQTCLEWMNERGESSMQKILFFWLEIEFKGSCSVVVVWITKTSSQTNEHILLVLLKFCK